MILASTQIKPFRNNIEANIQKHCECIELAAQHSANIIIFPEMSLTDYQLELADEYSFKKDDARLDVLKNLAFKNNMTIIAGAPFKTGEKLYLASFIIAPEKEISIYTKQYLHVGGKFPEDKFFHASFDFNPVIELENVRISPAICADITNPKHPKTAKSNGASVYAASIFYTPSGIAEAYEQLSGYAQKYEMNIIMSNYCGSSYGMEAAGQSAFWNSRGELVAHMNTTDEGLLFAKKMGESWSVDIISL